MTEFFIDFLLCAQLTDLDLSHSGNSMKYGEG